MGPFTDCPDNKQGARNDKNPKTDHKKCSGIYLKEPDYSSLLLKKADQEEEFPKKLVTEVMSFDGRSS